MDLLPCDIADGPREKYKALGIRSAQRHTEFLIVEERFLVHKEGNSFLPVLVIGRDSGQKITLIGLPDEADSGAKRLWVRDSELFNEPDEVSA